MLPLPALPNAAPPSVISEENFLSQPLAGAAPRARMTWENMKELLAEEELLRQAEVEAERQEEKLAALDDDYDNRSRVTAKPKRSRRADPG